MAVDEYPRHDVMVTRRRPGRQWFVLFLALLAGVAGFNGVWGGEVGKHSSNQDGGREGTRRHTKPLKIKVRQVLDGDTLLMASNERVRVLAIDTPEMGDDDLPPEPFAREATEFTSALLPKGSEVTLLHDQEKHDKFRRRLAFVQLPDGRDLGSLLLREGLAMVYIQHPNLSATQRYLALEKEARARGAGLWSAGGGRVVPQEQAQRLVGRYRLFTGKVTRVEWRKEQLVLKFGKGGAKDLEAVIHKREWDERFQPGPSATRRYLNRELEVRGRVGIHKGGVTVRVRHPWQITVAKERVRQ